MIDPNVIQPVMTPISLYQMLKNAIEDKGDDFRSRMCTFSDEELKNIKKVNLFPFPINEQEEERNEKYWGELCRRFRCWCGNYVYIIVKDGFRLDRAGFCAESVDLLWIERNPQEGVDVIKDHKKHMDGNLIKLF